jgi:hypothetical protein
MRNINHFTKKPQLNTKETVNAGNEEQKVLRHIKNE